MTVHEDTTCTGEYSCITELSGPHPLFWAVYIVSRKHTRDRGVWVVSFKGQPIVRLMGQEELHASLFQAR